MNTTAGFTGNVIIPANHKLVVNGLTEFGNDLVFNKPVEFKDYTKFKTIDADDNTVKRLDVTEKANYEELIVNNLEVQTELRFNSMLQTNPIANSKFAGTVEFGSNVSITNDSDFIIGDSDIKTTRNTDGLLLSSNRVKLGTNGVVAAGKVITIKGTRVVTEMKLVDLLLQAQQDYLMVILVCLVSEILILKMIVILYLGLMV